MVSYRSFPQVLSVAPGTAAEQAGVKEGDILQSIDGLSVITDAGAARLASAKAGEQVRLVFERNSKPLTISFMLGGTNARGAGPTIIVTGYLAMQTATGDMKLEVWSDDPIFPQAPTFTDGHGEIVLRIGEKTVMRLRLKKDSTEKSVGKPDEPTTR